MHDAEATSMITNEKWTHVGCRYLDKVKAYWVCVKRQRKDNYHTSLEEVFRRERVHFKNGLFCADLIIHSYANLNNYRRVM